MEDTIQEVLTKGVEMHVVGEFEFASKLYDAVIKLKPNHADANHNMGLLKVDIGNDLEALPYLQTALEADKSISQFWLSYVKTLIRLDRTEEAARVLSLKEDNCVETDELAELAQKLNVSSKMDIKQNSGTHTTNSCKHNTLENLDQNAALKLARRKTKEGSLDEANLIYKDTLFRFPKNKKAIAGSKPLPGGFIGETSKVQDPPQDQLQNLLKLYGQGRIHNALSKIKILLQEFPNSFNLFNIQGAANARIGLQDAAVESYKQALKIKPDYADAYNNMGVSLKAQGKLEEAIEVYKKAIELKPDYADAFYNMGSVFQKQDMLENAITYYKKALAIKPAYADAYNNMGVSLKAQGKLEEAIEAYSKAIKLKPDFAAFYNNKGAALQEQSKLEEAVEVYKKAIELKPDFADAYNNMGVSLKEQGKLEEAIEAYNKALYIDSNDHEAHNNLGILLSEQGRLEQAVSSFQEAFKARSGISLMGDEALAPATTSLFFELTNKCNFHCLFCPSDSQKRDIGSMDIELVKSLYDEAADKKIANEVNLHLMGEPTLHPKLIEILDFAASKNIKTDLVTNGSTLVDKVVPRILNSLYGTITASHMTPTKESYHFRGKVGLSWERYISNLRLLVREYMKRIANGAKIRNNINIRVMATQNTASNVNILETETEVRSILAEWNGFVTQVEQELGMVPFKRKDHNENDLLRQNLHASTSYPLQQGINLVFWRAFTFANTRVDANYDLKKITQAAYCTHPFTDVGILWNGDVTLCCMDHDGELKVGNIRESSIEDVIQNKSAKKLRASMLGQQPLPPVCQTCQAKPVRREDTI